MIRPKVSFIDRDAEWRKFRERMNELDGSSVSAGIHEDSGAYSEPGSPTVAQVAFFNEFGTERAPERSFIRSAYDEGESELNALRERLIEQLKEGKISADKALQTLGARMKAMIQNKIQSAVPPANAESTIRSKERARVGNSPLLWTRLLLRSIGFKVAQK